MSPRRRRKDGFLADYTLEQDYLQKPNVLQGRPGVFGGITSDGTPVLVKEWARNSGANDEDLEPIWRHELRQLHRLAGYPGAVESIAQLHDAGHDAKGFYLVIAPGQRQPLQTFLDRPGNDHWLKLPRAAGNRALIWSNLRRLALGLEALHAQGLLHRNLDAWSVLTAGVSEPDFQLTGFEWSMRITDRTSRHTPRTSVNSSDSFVKDWTLFGFLAAELVGIKRERLVDSSIAPSDIAEHVGVEEARLLRGLLQMMPLAPLNGEKVASSIDSVLRGLSAEVASRQASYHVVVRLGANSQLTDKIREASDQSIEADDIAEQMKFIESDLGEAPLVIAHRPKDAQNYRLLLRGRSLYYRLQEFRPNTMTSTWDFAYTEAVDYAPAPAGIVGSLLLTPESLEVIPLREASSKYARMRGKLSSWEDIRRQFEQEVARTSNEERVFLALELLQLLEAIYAVANVFAVDLVAVPRDLPATSEDGGQWLCVSLRRDPEREALSTALGLKPPAVRFGKAIESENVGSETWLLAEARQIGERDSMTSEWQFQRVIRGKEGRDIFLFAGLDGGVPSPQEPVMFVESVGQDVQLRRRSKALSALKEHQELLRMIIDPRRRILDSHDKLAEDEAFKQLDGPKQDALRQLTSTLPLFLVQGPPGVGKTRLVRDLVQRRFADEPGSRLLLTAQSNAAIDHLMDELEDSLGADTPATPLVVRSTKKDPREPPSKFDIQVQTRDLVRRLAGSELAEEVPKRLRQSLAALAAAPTTAESPRGGPAAVGSRGQEQALRVFEGVVARAANVVFATTNSGELERLIEERGQFDWAIVEEAAKATGSELVSPMLLSHRRLMIGDHQQLPAFVSDQMTKLLSDPTRVAEAKKLGKEFVARALRDSTTEDLLEDEDEEGLLPVLCSEALRLLTYFGSTIDAEFARQKAKRTGRPIAKRLTSQHRMHPAIAEMVSRCFYGDLDTDPECAARFQNTQRPFDSIDTARLPLAPIVIIDMPYVQSTIKQIAGDMPPVWHNPKEVDATVEVLSLLRARNGAKQPSLAVLSPYGQQRRRLDDAIHERSGDHLAHLTAFRSASHGGGRCFTVDSFQGSEADVVVVSLVRNNAHSSALQALGFLCDKRRMNVLLSRAKWQLVLVASLEFLKEVVAAAKGGPDESKVDFLAVMLDYFSVGEKKGTVARVPAAQLMRRNA